jgi:glutathione synthase/RimK-type ligase-like ATP-grasp enzyme
MRVLLTGARAPVTLDLARHFHREGHEVYLADSLRMPLARLSRVAKRTFFVSKPAQAPQKFIQDLVDIASRWRIDLIVPTCEEIFYLASNLNAFQGLCRVFAEPIEVLRILHNKWEFVHLLATMPDMLQAPESHLIADELQHRSWVDRSDHCHWVFKPVYSRFASRTLIGPNREALESLVPTRDEPWIAQRLIRGQELSTYSIARNGSLQAHACYRSRYRAGLGAGIYFEPVQHPLIHDFVNRFIERQKFTGQLGFDFMQEEDGHLYVLECNPRATSGLHLLRSQPISKIFEEADTPCMEPADLRPSMLGFAMLIAALPSAIRNGKTRGWFKDMFKARDAIWSWHDPLPHLLTPVSLIEVAATAWSRRISLTQASTIDMEWNGDHDRLRPQDGSAQSDQPILT